MIPLPATLLSPQLPVTGLDGNSKVNGGLRGRDTDGALRLKVPKLASRLEVGIKSSSSLNLLNPHYNIGVAIYYSCPSFTGDSMRFVLDGGSPENVNLSSSLTPDLRPDSSIVWWKTGLDFKNHTLEISPGENSTRVYLDAFVYVLSILPLAASDRDSHLVAIRPSRRRRSLLL